MRNQRTLFYNVLFLMRREEHMSEVLLYGKEPYSIEILIKRAKEKVENPAFNLSEFEVFDSDVINICNTVPFLAEKRLVIIKGDFSKKSPELLKYLDDPNPTTNLIIYAKVFKKNAKLAKKIMVKEYHKTSQSRLMDFIKATLQPKQISDTLCKYLIDRIGYLSDDNITLYDIESSVDKLKHLQRKIDKELINDVVPKSISNNVFELIDLSLGDQYEDAFEMLLNIDDRGLHVLSLFERAFRLMIKIQKGFTAKEIGIPGWNVTKLKGYKIPPKALGDLLLSIQQRKATVLSGTSSQEEACEVFFIEMLSILKKI